MRQASRRSWRIGQTEPVQVVFMAYRNTLQADALKLVAKKLQSSLAVEGELPEDGLAAYGDAGDDLMLALARRTPARSSRSSSRRGRSRPRPRRCWSTKAGARRSPSRSRRRSQRSSRSRTTRIGGRGGRCSRGPSSWPGSRTSRRAGGGARLPRSPSSSGRSSGSGRGRSPPGRDGHGGIARLRWCPRPPVHVWGLSPCPPIPRAGGRGVGNPATIQRARRPAPARLRRGA